MKRLLGVAILTLCACSGPDDKKEENTDKVVEQPSLADSACMGDRVPPTGWKQATAFVDVNTPDAADSAREEAVAELRDRICQGYRCSEIEPKISLWNTEADARQVCAMAVIKASDIAAFQEAPRAELAQNLTASASALLKMLGKKTPKIAIDNVRDNGIDGGARAEWLIDRMNAALSKSGGRVGKLPKGWSGLKLPSGVDGVLRGRITRMHGRESMLEITWTLDIGDAFSSVDPIIFPEFIGPNTNSTLMAPDISWDSREISVRFDARPGGGLCNGQQFEIQVETAQKLHIRVVNLFGNDAMVIYGSKGAVNKGRPVSLGQFMAIKAEGVPPAEQFIALGAKSEADLGRFAKPAAIPCRVPAADVKAMSTNDGFPKNAYKTSRGYRIVEGEDCSAFKAPDVDVLAEIKKLPACW